MKRFSLILSLGIVCLLGWIAHIRTDGFHVAKILRPSQFTYPSIHTRMSEKKELFDDIFSQPFFYRGHGRQAYIFESSDGQYILKCLNHARFHFPQLFWRFPLPPFLEKKRNVLKEKKEKKLNLFFEGYSLANQRMGKTTCIVLLSFFDNFSLTKEIELIDHWGDSHRLSLNRITYVLQRKAYPLPDILQNIEKTKNIEKLDTLLDSYLQILLFRCHNLLGDDDARCLENMGLYRQKFVIFDCGRMYHKPELNQAAVLEEELIRATSRMKKWIRKNFPDYNESFERKIEKVLAGEITQKPL